MTTSGPDALSSLLCASREPRAHEVTDLARRASTHPVFRRMKSISDVRVLMEHHVWAVWDFMSLLKSVQEAVAPVRVPWLPVRDAESARLVNEIVVGEECDDGPDGRPASHFEIYLRAMRRAGADARPITRFLAALEQGAAWPEALSAAGAPAAARAFVQATLEVCAGPLHGRVAALTLGREDIIPAMFSRLVQELDGERGADLADLRWYLDRHVEVDGTRHGPMTARLFERVCARDAATLAESLEVAARVLSRRVALWSAVEEALGPRTSGVTWDGHAPS